MHWCHLREAFKETQSWWVYLTKKHKPICCSPILAWLSIREVPSASLNCGQQHKAEEISEEYEAISEEYCLDSHSSAGPCGVKEIRPGCPGRGRMGEWPRQSVSLSKHRSGREEGNDVPWVVSHGRSVHPSAAQGRGTWFPPSLSEDPWTSTLLYCF